VAAFPETVNDLLEAHGAAVLTTIGADALPQSTAVWFLFDDGVVKVSLNTARQKVKNLQRNPAASLFFIDPANQYHTLEIRSRVQLLPDGDYEFADKIGAKYGASLRDMDKGQPGVRMVAIFEPTTFNAR